MVRSSNPIWHYIFRVAAVNVGAGQSNVSVRILKKSFVLKETGWNIFISDLNTLGNRTLFSPLLSWKWSMKGLYGSWDRLLTQKKFFNVISWAEVMLALPGSVNERVRCTCELSRCHGGSPFRAGIIIFLILAHPVYKNVNNTGTKYVRIMKQTAFWRKKNGEYIPCLNYFLVLAHLYIKCE